MAFLLLPDTNVLPQAGLLCRERQTHTVLTHALASGYALQLFMIYPRKWITDNLKVGALPVLGSTTLIVGGLMLSCSLSGLNIS